MKPRCGKVNLCYRGKGSFIVHVKLEDIYTDLSGDVKKRIHTSTNKVKRPLSIGKNRTKIGLMKDEIGGKIMKEYVAPMPKTGSYFTGNRSFKKRKKRIQTNVLSYKK